MSDSFALSTDQTILGLDGQGVANGQVHFYSKATGEYAPVYGDAALTVSLRQPVQADSSGVLPVIYLDDGVAYRAVITDRDNNRIREIDDVRRHREGIKVLGGIDALKRFCGNDPFVLVATEGGCPVFYKRLSGCDLPEEHLPDVVRAECGCDCSVAWQLCGNDPTDICGLETAELNCDYHVLVQECQREEDPDGSSDCRCDDGSAASTPALKKASIGALLSAGAQCLPRVCIPHDAPELALVGGGLVQGDREPPPLDATAIGAEFSQCILVLVGTAVDDFRHVQLDTIKDLNGNQVKVPEIKLENKGHCRRRYEIRAINRLNRARDHDPANWNTHQFHDPPVVDANFQTRLGKKGDPLLSYALGVGDYPNNLPWLTNALPSLTALSIADSTMGPFNSGHYASGPDPHHSANGYTQNSLIVDLQPGDVVSYALTYHIYWDMTASPAKLALAERVHFGTRIIAYQIR